MVIKYFKPYEYGQSRINHLIYDSLHTALLYVYGDEHILFHRTVGRYNIAKFRATELMKLPLPRQLVDNALKNRGG